MKFKLIKQVDGEVPAYGETVKTGGTIELTGRMAEKAQANPDFEAVVTKKTAKKKAK